MAVTLPTGTALPPALTHVQTLTHTPPPHLHPLTAHKHICNKADDDIQDIPVCLLAGFN